MELGGLPYWTLNFVETSQFYQILFYPTFPEIARHVFVSVEAAWLGSASW